MNKLILLIIQFSLFSGTIIFTTTSATSAEPDTIKFIHITDLHISKLAGYHPTIVRGRQHYGEGVNALTNFFKSVPKKTQSDFVAVTGDVIDFYEGETNLGDMQDTQIEWAAPLLEMSKVPVYLTLGNHDIVSYNVNPETKKITGNQYNSGIARAAWIRNVPCFSNGTYYSKTFEVDTITYRLIFLDNAYFKPDRISEGPHYFINPEQLYWLDNEMKKSDTDVEIIFMHMPLTNPLDEDVAQSKNKYFLNINDTVAISRVLQKSETNSIDLYDVLQQNCSARLILTGHKHSSVIHDFNFSDDYSLTHVITGSLARDSRNWRLIQLTSENINISFPGNTSTQYKIPLD